MKNIEINYYERITKPTVTKNIMLKEWLELIKESNNKEKIIEARIVGKQNKDGLTNTNYDEIKKDVPCVTYNFTFDKDKRDENIIESTGILYIDVDTDSVKNKDFQISNLDKSKILAYYKSFGGNGYAILVKVNGLTKYNFKSAYKYIISGLKIEKYFDINARKKTQFSVLSYDPNIFINYDSFEFDVSNLVDTDNVYTPQSEKYLTNKEKIYSSERGVDNNTQIRFNNFLDLIDFEEKSYVRIKDGINVIEAQFPFYKIEEGNRHQVLMSYCGNYLYLNPFLDFDSAFRTLNKLNSKNCIPPLSSKDIKGIVNSFIRYRDTNTLKPFVTTRYIIANPTFIGIINKREEVLRLLALNKTEKSIEKLRDIISNWNWKELERISQRKVYKNHPISKKTVEKYWKEVKDSVDYWNQYYDDSI